MWYTSLWANGNNRRPIPDTTQYSVDRTDAIGVNGPAETDVRGLSFLLL